MSAPTELERARDRLLALHDAFEAAGASAAGAARRRAAREAFAAQGLPHGRLEAWRYTSLAALAEVTLALPGADEALDRDALEAIASPVFACSLAAFVNGRHRPELALPHALEGDVEVAPFAWEAGRALAEGFGGLVDAKRHPFAALNLAFQDDGVSVRVPSGQQLTHPLHLVFASSGDRPLLVQPRLAIEAGAGSRAVVLLDHVMAGPRVAHLTNALLEVRVAAGASLDLIVLQREHDSAFHVSNLTVHQARASRFGSHVITLGGRLVRNDLELLLAGEGAEARLNGLFLGDGERVVDNHTLVDHAVPHCRSEELYKGVLADRSRGVFRGRVHVRPGAIGTDARQSNPNLLLTDGAEIDTRPQLEIHADDVKCSHGSSIGRTDPDALFYLRTRGIGEREARRLLMRGFAAEVVEALPGAGVAAGLFEVVERRLAELGGRP